MFRNESEAVIGKAKAREKSKAKAKEKQRAVQSSSSSPSSSSSVDDEVDQEILKKEFAEFTLQQPDKLVGGFVRDMMPMGAFSLPPNTQLQTRAQAFFYSKSSLWLQNFDLLSTLCSQTTADEHLLASMSAVGLASLSNSLHTPELLNRSRKDYITALHLTNAALRSPTDVKKDSTLFSVMILSIYETITGSDTRSLAAWTKHINGATALVKLRGREQFKTTAGQRMFLQVLSYLMLSCIQRTLAMPAHMIELRETAAKYMDVNKAAWQTSGAIIDFTLLRAAIRNGEILGPKSIIEKALALDQRFADIFADPPKEFRYKKVYTKENPHLVWKGMYHVYATHWTAQIWNGTRTCRILLHEAIRDQILVDSTAMEPYLTTEEAKLQHDASVGIMMECQRDILASVPQHTGAQDSMEPASLLEGSRGYFILWPLYLVGVMDLSTNDVRDWVAQRLRGLSDVAGISQAKVLGDYIAARENPWEWDTKPVPNIRKGIVERAGKVAGFQEWDELEE
jgi:hypothetical protein